MRRRGLIITPCASRIPATPPPPPRVTYTCNLTDTKLVGYKIMRGSRNFFRGGGGAVNARRPEMDNVFFILLSFCPQLILQFIEGVQWFYYRENYTFPRIQKGSNIFQGGGFQLFLWGVLIVISKETHIMWFSRGGGVRTPFPCKIAI